MKQQNQEDRKNQPVRSLRKNQDRWTAQLPRRTMLKVTESDGYLVFKTVTSEWKSGTLYVNRKELSDLNYKEKVVVNDGGYLAVFYRDIHSGMVTITFYWTQCSDGTHLTGQRSTVRVSWMGLSDFMSRSAASDSPETWKVLSADENYYPRLVFANKKRLEEVASNKLVRRKFSKFIRDAFRWPDSEVIYLYADFVPYSFMFREYRYGEEHTYGGVILHNQEDMSKAYYSMHT